MIRELDRPTTPLVARPRINPYALDLLFVAARLLICLAAIYAGILIAVNAPNEGIAVLAALACGGVIYGLLGKGA